ncbi:MAG: PAS domain-containing sensor histidine kinase [Daejeonella sp.]
MPDEFQLMIKDKMNESNYHLLTDLMPQQVWTANPDGRINYVNKNTIEYFGRSFDEIIGNGWQEFIHPDDLFNCIEVWTRSLSTGEPYEIEFRLQAKDGVYYWHLGRATPAIKHSEIIQWFGTNTLIESHKQNEAKKDEFISMASHELKTPLTSLKGYLQILSMRVKSDAQNLNFVEKALMQITRLEGLTNNLLDVSKISADKLILNKTEFEFKDLITRCVDIVGHSQNTHTINIKANETIAFDGDLFRLEQVVINFLTNAIKYSPNAKEIIVSSTVQSDGIVVCVEDFGIGIEPEHLEKLFDRFYRIDNANSKFEGLGLGLYIASTIIKSHNGEFWIDSEVNKGSKFYFRLPLAENKSLEPETDSKTFYKDKRFEIDIHPANEILEISWIGYQDEESITTGTQQVMSFLRSNKFSKLLNDNSRILGNWSEASSVLTPEVHQELFASGLRYLAWVLPAHKFGQLAAFKALNNMDSSDSSAANNLITIEFFEGREEAENWLNSFN